jgi:DNA-directed RNA polymerase specialized sigma24 family protein
MKKNSNGHLTEPIEPWEIIRECLRHYTEFRRFAATDKNRHDSLQGVIEHTYQTYDEDDNVIQKYTFTISLWDLFDGMNKISKRKREALWYHIILDKSQKECETILGIKQATIGQYCSQSLIKLANVYLNHENDAIMEGDDPKEPIYSIGGSTKQMSQSM